MNNWPQETNWISKIRMAVKKDTRESFSPDIIGTLLLEMLDKREPITYESLVKKFNDLGMSGFNEIYWNIINGEKKGKTMKANRCRIYCLEMDYSTNKIVFNPIHENCKSCEYLNERLRDNALSELINKMQIKKETIKNEINTSSNSK